MTGPTPRFSNIRIPLSGKDYLAGSFSRPCDAHCKDAAVVLVHGFAAERTENGLFLDLAHGLVARGYSVLLYDCRGCGKSSGDYATTTVAEHVRDFRTTIEWLLTKRCHSTSIFGVGFSLGATIVALAAKRDVNLAGVVFWSPAFRPAVSMWPRYNSPETRFQLANQGFIFKPENHVRLGKKLLDSLRRTDLGCDAITADLRALICHGTEDSRISVSLTREIVSNAKSPHLQYIEFKGASHSFKPQRRHRDKLLDVTYSWLDEQLSVTCSYAEAEPAGVPRPDSP